jgi:uncharacterized OsmC-like protein
MPKKIAKAKWIENVRSVVDNSRTHSVVCDLTLPEGGSDSGPTALELALMSLADCSVTIFADVCKKSNIELGKLDVAVEAEKSPVSPIITGVTVKVTVSAKARKELLEGAWRRTEANCPVISIFTEPIPVKIEFEAKQE